MPFWKSRSERGKRHTFDPLLIQLLVWFTFLWILLLSVTFTITLRFSQETLESNIEGTIMSTASALADSFMVRDALEEGKCSPQLIAYLDELVEFTDDMDVLTIADTKSIRIYHVVHDRIGGSFVGGDEGPALRGECYINDGVGTMGLQRRAFCPVYDSSGSILGFVMVSTTLGRIEIMRQDIIEAYGKMLLVLILVSLAVATLLSFLVRSFLHGYSPEELVRTYLDQNKTLESLDEGIIYVGPKGRIQLLNESAVRMLGSHRDVLIGQPVDEIIRAENGTSLREIPCKQIPSTLPNLLLTSLPEMKGGKYQGTTLILIDKTEAVQAAEQLTGTHHMISTLRANSHEFMNRLQVIAGLLQMDKQEEALAYISDIAQLHAEAIGPVVQRIQNSNVAALILGKLNNMRELNIQLTLLPNSSLPHHSKYLSSDELVTLIGNLMENAIEAINAGKQESPRNLVLQITEDWEGLLVMVSDTGEGIPAHLQERIYTHGFSTKAPEGRGVGMGIIRSIVNRHRGSIELESEPGAGTTFTLIFSEIRERRKES